MDNEKEILTQTSINDDERNELEQFRRDKQIKENLQRELEIIKEVFGDIDIDDIPDEVFARCFEGKGLAGEYALWHLKSKKEHEEADRKNESNYRNAPPKIHDGDGDVYFTPDQVKAMKSSDVRRHYKSIIKSMEKWK